MMNDLNLVGQPDGPPNDPHPADQSIGMEANTMLKSIRVPETGPLTTEQREEIQATVAAHMKEHRIVYRVVAQQIGAGESSVNESLRSVYKGDQDAILRKLNRWIDDDERRRQKIKPIGFHPTCVFDGIRALAAFAKSNARLPGSAKSTALAADPPRIVVGWAPAGSGKSLGARALNAEDTSSILVRIESRHGTDTTLARLIVAAAGWRCKGRGFELIEFVRDKLKDSGRLVIIDEAHRLQTSGCEFIRDLVDVCGIPVLLLATEEFYERMTSVRTGGGRKLYDQFSRRVGYVLNLLRGVDGRGGSKRPIYSEEEVRHIFRVQGLRVASDAIQYLQATACTIGLGMLGLAANIFELAVRSALRKNRVIDAALLRRMAERVLIPPGESDAGILRQIDITLDTNLAMESRRAAASA